MNMNQSDIAQMINHTVILNISSVIKESGDAEAKSNLEETALDLQ